MVARKTSTLPTRIYSYHALAPTRGAERVTELLRLAERYYDALIGIELEDPVTTTGIDGVLLVDVKVGVVRFYYNLGATFFGDGYRIIG